MADPAAGEGLLRRPHRRLVRHGQRPGPERLSGGLLRAVVRVRHGGHAAVHRQSRYHPRRHPAPGLRSHAVRDGGVPRLPVRNPERVPVWLGGPDAGDGPVRYHGQPAAADRGVGANLPATPGAGPVEQPDAIRPVQPALPPDSRPAERRAAAGPVRRLPPPHALCRPDETGAHRAERFALSNAPGAARDSGAAVSVRPALPGDRGGLRGPLHAVAQQLPDPGRQREDLCGRQPADPGD